jgi:hypothetical protein
MGARTVYFFSERKQLLGVAVLGVVWLLLGPVLAVCLAGAFLFYQHRRFQAAIIAHRMRRTLVVHTGGAKALARANKLSQNGKCDVLTVLELEACREGFFTLVDGSVSLCLVTDDRDHLQAGKFLDWLHTESTTRMRESRTSGWRFNIVYTGEGRRRGAFLRLVFSVESVFGNEWPAQLSSYLTSFGALRVDDAVEFSQSIHPEQDDMLDICSFWSWLLGCSCCTQRVIESQRFRPSKFRVSFKDMLQAALISNEAAWQVYRSLKEAAIGWMPVHFFTKEVPFPFAHNHPLRCPGESVYFVSTWGDETQLEADQKVENLDPSQYVVSSHFRIVNCLGHASHEQWWWEVAARFPGKHVVVTHPRSRGEFAFQIGDARTLSFLEGLKPGAAADPNCPHQQWLVQSGLWVRVDGADTKDNLEEMNTELHGKGYTVVAPHRLIAAPYWNAVRKYHRALRPWLYEFSGEGNGKGKFRTWNDEPVARQIQMALTNWATRVSGERCVVSVLLSFLPFTALLNPPWPSQYSFNAVPDSSITRIQALPSI